MYESAYSIHPVPSCGFKVHMGQLWWQVWRWLDCSHKQLYRVHHILSPGTVQAHVKSLSVRCAMQRQLHIFQVNNTSWEVFDVWWVCAAGMLSCTDMY